MRGDRQVWFWLAALAGAVAVIWALKDVLLPFVVGMILAYALNPIAEMLVRRGLSRTLASALVVALIVLSTGVALLFLVPRLVAQTHSLIESLPKSLAQVRTLIEDIAKERLGDKFAEFRAGLDQAIAGLQVNWSQLVPAVLRSVWSQGLAIFNLASLLLITPLVVFYLLVDWYPMLARIDGWLPRDKAPVIRRLAGEMDAAIGAFIRGQGLVCLILGAFYAIGLSWAGLRYGLVVGLATGLLSFVPFIGWALGLVVAVAMTLAQAWPDLVPLYVVLAIYVAGMALDSALLSPHLVGKRVGLHPLWLLFALYVFSWAMGFVGMLVAVPLAAAFAVLVRHLVEVYLASDLYRGKAHAQAAGGSPGTPGGTASP